MERVLLLLLVVGVCQALPAQKYTRTVSYEDELVARCNGVQLQDLLELDGLDVWSISPDGTADIRMKKELYKELKVVYPECSILHSSVEAVVREAERQMRLKNLTADWFEEYHPFVEIVDWYKQLSEANPRLVEYVKSIGKTVQGREQLAVHITAPEPGPEVKKIYLQCQIHAREWISGATCMYLANHLVENYEKDERVTDLLKEVEFVIVPCVNPDGYEYTWSTDRLWRKNRRVGPSLPCYGVDLNRNYPDHWEWTNGSSPNECAEIYRGPSAASEPETQNIMNYFTNEQNRPIVGAFDFHSFSQLILRPYGWTYDNTPDDEQLKTLGEEMSDDIFNVHGKRYISQRAVDLYPGTGTALDWFYSDDANNENGEYRAGSMVIELRDTGQYGFLLPPDQIIPTGEEMVPAVLRFAENLSEEPLKFNKN